MQMANTQPNHAATAQTRVSSTWAVCGLCVKPIGFAQGGTAP